MDICHFCQTNIFECKGTWGYHQESPSELEKSARGGCPICVKLTTSAKAEVETFANPSSQQPQRGLYRWSLRRAAKVRESYDYLMLTFRANWKKAVHPSVRFYLIPETKTSADLGSRTDSDSSWDQVKDWIVGCKANHETCKQLSEKTAFLPTRLLDIGTTKMDTVRVIYTENDASIRDYVTISHAWGKKQFARLTENTKKAYMSSSGIPLADIQKNKNLEEAIEVTRRIGIRHLWMDSLCIIQEGKDSEKDWIHESQLMHEVYRNSHCNIAAADSKDPDGGLFRKGSRGIDSIVLSDLKSVELGINSGNRTWRIESSIWQDELLSGPLYGRAWVFQERMLAPRILHYSKNQIFWDCSSISACETFPKGLPGPLDTAAATDRHWRERLRMSSQSEVLLAGRGGQSPESLWKTAVWSYTSCALTFQRDKFEAIRAVAVLVGEALDERLIHGLWENSFHEQLAWKVVDSPDARRPDEAELKAREPFPTWSWLSLADAKIAVAGRVPLIQRFYTITNHQGQDVYIENVNPDTTMQTDRSAISSPTRLAIRGHVGPAKIRFSSSFNRYIMSVEGFTQKGTTFQESFDMPRPDTEFSCKFLILAASRELLYKNGRPMGLDEEEHGGFAEGGKSGPQRAVYCGIGLLLENDNTNGDFKRIGTMAFKGLDGDSWLKLRLVTGQNEMEVQEEMKTGSGREIWLS